MFDSFSYQEESEQRVEYQDGPPIMIANDDGSGECSQEVHPHKSDYFALY